MPALEIEGLLLREVVLPERRDGAYGVSCRFDLVDPAVRIRRCGGQDMA